MARSRPATRNFHPYPGETVLPRCLCGVIATVLFLAWNAAAGPALAKGGSDDPEGNGFALVAQALQARLRLIYRARQDILWMTPTGGMAQVVADIARAGRRTRITYRFPPEAAGRVMLDDGVRYSLYDPSHRALIVSQSAADDQTAASPATLVLLRRNYRCLCLSREAVNGQTCDVVAIRPRVHDGPSKRLWIDAARHAILRTEEYDAQGCRRYVSFYETIQFLPHLPTGDLDLPGPARRAATQRMSVQSLKAASAPRAFTLAGVVGRLPAWRPWGFALMHCSVIGAHSGTKSVLLDYSDGLKSLVVLEEPSAGAHPTSTELNRALARYGQQAWVQEDGRLRTVVRGDLSLPDALGAEMMQALSARTDGILSRGLAHDFGRAAAHQGALLRRTGWGYDQISALCLWQKSHPRLRARLKPLLNRNAPWSRIANVFGAEAASLTSRSRAWVASTLAVAH